MTWWETINCRLGFHIGRWGQPYIHEIDIVSEDTGKVYYTKRYGAQRRICTRCSAITMRRIRAC